MSLYPTGMVMLGAGKGQWQEGAEGLGHPGIVQGWASLLCGGNVYKYCSYGVRREVFLSGLRRVNVLSMGPYSCLLWMCNAYADSGSLFFMYRVCSWYLSLRVRLV